MHLKGAVGRQLVKRDNEINVDGHVVMEACCFGNDSDLGMAKCLTQTHCLLFNVSDCHGSSHRLQGGSGFGLALCNFGAHAIVATSDPKRVPVDSKSLQRIEMQSGIIECKRQVGHPLGAQWPLHVAASEEP
jgi:hypothetical protein